jgi:hypothetical protein
MNRKTLDRLHRRLKELRAAPANITRKKLVGLSKSLGMRPDKRGKEPTYVSDDFPQLTPLSIPSHREINKFTAKDILDGLEIYIFAWKERLRQNQTEL